MKLTEKQIQLLMATLNFCNLQKKVFLEHLKYQGHEDTAKEADQQLERLRRKLASSRKY